MNKSLDSIIYAFQVGWWCDPVVGVVYKPDGSAAKTYTGGSGYLVVNLPRRNPTSPKSSYKSVAVHRVIAYCIWGNDAFRGHAVCQTRHLDGNRTNNTIGNLALGTPRDNTQDMSKEARSERSSKRWQSLDDAARDKWRSRIADGFAANRQKISESMKLRYKNTKEESDIRLDYARAIRYGHIDRSVSLEEFKGQQTLTNIFGK